MQASTTLLKIIIYLKRIIQSLLLKVNAIHEKTVLFIIGSLSFCSKY